MGNSALSPGAKIYVEDPNISMVQSWIHNCDWKNISMFIDNEPLYLKMKDAKGKLPIHNAFIKKAPDFIINQLISHDIESLLVSDYDDLYPVHYAIISGYSSSFLINFFKQYPDNISLLDKDGRNVFHYCLMYGAKYDIIVYLADLPAQTLQYSGISNLNLTSGKLTQGFVESRVRSGKLGIHFAIENRANYEIIEFLINRYPDSAQEYFDGNSPLHLACLKRCPFNIIQLLVKTFPDVVKQRGNLAAFPLHLAAANKAEPDTINLLLTIYPDACLEKDRTLRNPLHYALENSLSEEGIFAIMLAAPDAAKAKGHGGKIALHVAIDRGYKYNIIKELLNMNPNAAKETDSFNVLPLKLAISKLNCPDSVMDIIKANPKACSVPDEFGRVAFHYGVSRKFPNSVLQAIYEAAPESINCIDQNNQLPLHLAIKRVPELEMIRLLLGNSKESVMIVDRYGYLPIHYALEGDATEDMVKLLVKTDPRCLTVKAKGKLPLHFACEFKKSTAMLKILIAGYKDATLIKEDAEGRIPLCWAISRRMPIQSLLVLEAANHDEIAFIEDHEGHLPIHYCLKYGSHHELTRVLLESNPRVALEVNLPRHCYTKEEIDKINEEYSKQRVNVSQKELDLREMLGGFKGMYHFNTDIVIYGKSKRVHSGRLLIHYAIENLKAHPNSVAEVMMLTMPLSHIDGTPNPDHKFTWTYLISETNDKYWESVDIILKRYEHIRNAIKYLCDIPNEQGYKAINVCSPECQKQILRRLYYFGRYELMQGPYLHTSLNSLVILALDHEDDKRMVALKFMKFRQQFDREVNLRANVSLSKEFVVPILHSHDGESDPMYKEETILKGFKDYPFCIVMLASERDLSSIIVHEYFADRNWDIIRDLAIEILHCLKHLHDKGLIHGDLKPLSIVRESGKLKLIDLGGSASFWKQEFAGTFKSSSAYIPPEMVQAESSVIPEFNRVREPFDVTEDLGGVVNNSVRISKITGLPLPVHSSSNECILAAVTIDMWSFGALFYQMCTGLTLLDQNCFDEIDIKTLNALRDWTHSYKWRTLGKVKNSLARNVLDQLLAKEPRRRPTVDYILKHPFFTQKPSYRYPSMEAVSDIYVSYRWKGGINPHHQLKQVSWGDIQKNSLILGEATDEEFYKLSEDGKYTLVPLMCDDEKHHYILQQLLLSYGFIVSSSVSPVSNEQTAAISPFEKQDFSEIDLNTTLNISAGDDEDDDDRFGDKMTSFLAESKEAVKSEIKVNKCNIMNDRESFYGAGRVKVADDIINAKNNVDSNSSTQAGSPYKNDTSVMKQMETLMQRLPSNSKNKDSNDTITNPPIPTEDCYIRSCINMIQSRCAIFLLSRYAINDMIDESSLELMTPNSLIHQMLFEMRFALELREMGLLECGIMAVCIGDTEFNTNSPDAFKPLSIYDSNDLDVNSAHYGLYFSSYKGELLGRMGACHPKHLSKFPVDSIEEKLREALDFFHLGQPVEEKKSVNQIVSDIISNDSYFVSGPGHIAWPNVADDLFNLLRNDTMFKSSSRGASIGGTISRPSTSQFDPGELRVSFSREEGPRIPSKSKSLPPTSGAQTRFKNFTARNTEAIKVYQYENFETTNLKKVGEEEEENKSNGTSKLKFDDIDGESHLMQNMRIKIQKKDEENSNLVTEIDLLKKQVEMLTQDINRLRYLNGELIPSSQ